VECILELRLLGPYHNQIFNLKQLKIPLYPQDSCIFCTVLSASPRGNINKENWTIILQLSILEIDYLRNLSVAWRWFFSSTTVDSLIWLWPCITLIIRLFIEVYHIWQHRELDLAMSCWVLLVDDSLKFIQKTKTLVVDLISKQVY